MYVYLGGEAAIEDRQIVGIFDLDNASWSPHTRKYLSMAEKTGKLTNAAEDIPKSFVVCADETVILTQPNTAILVKRLDSQEKTNV
jgi:hypothetical protein